MIETPMTIAIVFGICFGIGWGITSAFTHQVVKYLTDRDPIISKDDYQ